MNEKTRFRAVDILLLTGALLPLVACMVLKVLFTPATEGITITGALVYFTIPLPLQPLPITEAQVNSWAVMLTILFLCLYLTHGIAVRPGTKRQLAAEWIVEKCKNMVHTNMGDYFAGFAPFIAAIMGLSALSSLLSLLGLFPPTSDMNVVAGWAILVFGMVTFFKIKTNGFLGYLKGGESGLIKLLGIADQGFVPVCPHVLDNIRNHGGNSIFFLRAGEDVAALHFGKGVGLNHFLFSFLASASLAARDSMLSRLKR